MKGMQKSPTKELCYNSSYVAASLFAYRVEPL